MADEPVFYAVRRRLFYNDWRGADEWRIFRGLCLYPWSRQLRPECLTADRVEALKVHERFRESQIVSFTLKELAAREKK